MTTITKSNTGRAYEAKNGSVTVTFWFVDEERVQVCVQNASAKVYSRGLGGRIFRGLSEALKAYKSESAKECILAVAADRMLVAA